MLKVWGIGFCGQGLNFQFENSGLRQDMGVKVKSGGCRVIVMHQVSQSLVLFFCCGYLCEKTSSADTCVEHGGAAGGGREFQFFFRVHAEGYMVVGVHQVNFGSFLSAVEVERVFVGGLGETEIHGNDVGTTVGGECQGADVAFFHDFSDFNIDDTECHGRIQIQIPTCHNSQSMISLKRR